MNEPDTHTVCKQCKGIGYYDEGHENDDGTMLGGNYVECDCQKKDLTTMLLLIAVAEGETL